MVYFATLLDFVLPLFGCKIIIIWCRCNTNSNSNNSNSNLYFTDKSTYQMLHKHRKKKESYLSVRRLFVYILQIKVLQNFQYSSVNVQHISVNSAHGCKKTVFGVTITIACFL